MHRRFDSSLPLLRSPALRAIERLAGDEPLMERAGAAAAQLAGEIRGDREAGVLVIAGPGNNGGDALVTARLLRRSGVAVDLVLAGAPHRLPPAAAAAHAAFVNEGGQPLAAIPERPGWGLIIDGLFGIGLTRPPADIHAELIAAMNAAADCPLLALDAPSGLDTDTGRTPGIAVRATHTITFIAGKPGLLTHDGPDHCGGVHLAPLDLDVEALLAALPDDPENVGRVVGPELFSTPLRRRPHNSHKGSFGTAGIIGGAPGMAGAAVLAGRAALKLGAGRVFVGFVAPPPALDPAQPELMLRSATDCLSAPLTALACGPGLGTSAEAAALLAAALAAGLPLVLDADALNLIAVDGDLANRLAARPAPAVLTPHPAEAARLLGSDVAGVLSDRIAAARTIAARHHAWVALKGNGTIIAAPDGHWWINGSGSPLLATAGSGDVLTGFVVALLAQGWPPAAAVPAAVLLHGSAGEALTGTLGGAIGGTAGEIIDAARRLFNRWAYSD